MTDGVDLREFVSAYLAETEEHLRTANAQLLAVDASLRKGDTNARAVRELFRVLHTIKGLSAMVGVEPVVAIAHRMETALRVADRGGGRLPLPSVDLLLQGVRAIEHRVRALGEGKAVSPPPAALLDALDALEARADVGAVSAPPSISLEPAIASKLAPFELEHIARGARDGRRAVRLDFAPSAERAAAGLTITSVRERVGALAEIVKVVPVALPRSDASPGGLTFVLLVLSAASDGALAAAAGVDVASLSTIAEAPEARTVTEPTPDLLEPEEPEPEAHRKGAVRVDVARLDDAMERLSALIVTRARLALAVVELTAQGVNTRDLQLIVHDSARQLRDMRASILRVRMVPMGEVLERVPLLVRGLQRASGKLVRVVLDVGQAELDKAVAEQLFPAIVHLVRNAVDHAVEAPAERRRAGKPEEATLRIACAARSNTQLELSVADDGRGVDREAVARRAGRPAPLTDAALLQMLCRPGLTTQAEASTTSGRGMGMDIVRRITVEQLGGALFMTTAPDVGTTFTLRVPLTISIVEAFAFQCGAQRFVVPLSVVEEVLDVDPARVVRGPSRVDRVGPAVGIIERRGEALPFIGLDAAFGLGASGANLRKALVVRCDGEAIAFGVDRMLGQQEVVVRPLEDPMLKVPGVAGATDLGDGRPTLVLDLVSLCASLAGATGGAS